MWISFFMSFKEIHMLSYVLDWKMFTNNVHLIRVMLSDGTFLIKVLIFIQYSIYFDISQDVNNKVRKLIHNKENFSKLKKFTKKCANNH